MNRTLLLKWWWRFTVESTQLWKSVLIAKYKFRLTGALSFFWKLVISLIPIMCISLKCLVGSGKSILFWFDVWYGEFPFYILFPNLFAKAKTPRLITVEQVWNKGNVKIPLIRGASLLL
jgi:hypothetical protein